MKIDRLIAIINILTEKNMVTAKELADKFEVSRRTILRDVDTLSMAGLPIITSKGNGGGISLMEGYTFDKRVFTSSELEDMVTGIKGIQSVMSACDSSFLSEKIANVDEAISIDLSSHYKGSVSKKIAILRKAISCHQCVGFTYYSPKGKTLRNVEPIKIIYQWSDWYLAAYCLEKEAVRFFKLQRLWDLQALDQCFQKRSLTSSDLSMGKHLVEDQNFEALFEPTIEYLVAEAYGPHAYDVLESGKLLFKGSYTDQAYIVRWLLSFGKDVQVLGPKNLIDAIKEQSENSY